MNEAGITEKPGRELSIGDALMFGSEPRTVVGFDAHPGVEAYGVFYPARVACCGEKFRITVFDSDTVEVATFRR